MVNSGISSIWWGSLYAGGQCTLAVAICRRLLYAGGHLGSRCSLAEAREREFIKVDLVGSPIYTQSGSQLTLPVCRSLYPGTCIDCTLYAGGASLYAAGCCILIVTSLYTVRWLAVCWPILLVASLYAASSGSHVAVHLTWARLLSTTLYAAGCCILVVALL